jgi:polysaccharide export outer membrane protein
MEKKTFTLLLSWAILSILLSQLSACLNTKQVTYISPIQDTTLSIEEPYQEPLIQKNDILSIQISSLNAEASSVFNTTNTQATSTTGSNGYSTGAGGYLVNHEGNVQLPLLGSFKAAGLTKNQLKQTITDSIISKNLLIDPIVSIRHLNFDVTIIGEVGKPTVINVPNEKISLLKALGLAGDITIYGKKENVLIVREVEGVRKATRINVNSKDFLTSPYYYLQPNDIVYVEPNKQKVITANRNQQLLPSILSGLSIIAIVVTQLVK